jgi:hypothetical protein
MGSGTVFILNKLCLKSQRPKQLKEQLWAPVDTIETSDSVKVGIFLPSERLSVSGVWSCFNRIKAADSVYR